MKILNLTNEETSDIKYKISIFPDGQQDITITEFRFDKKLPKDKNSVEIKSRFNSFKDLELIIAST